MSMQCMGSDSIKSIKYLRLQAVSWHCRLEIKHEVLRLIILIQIILQKDLCPFPRCPFFSTLSDDCLKTVNTNVKVGMSQRENGLLSFTERHFPNRQTHQQDLTTMILLGFFLSKQQLVTNSAMRWYSSDTLGKMLQQHSWWQIFTCAVGYCNDFDLFCTAHWDENCCITSQGNMISFTASYEGSHNTGISSIPSTILSWLLWPASIETSLGRKR